MLKCTSRRHMFCRMRKGAVMDRRRVLFLAASFLGLVWAFPANVALGEGTAGTSVSGDIITKETEPYSVDGSAADKTETGEMEKYENDKNEVKNVGVTKTEGTLEDKETVKNEEERKIEDLVINKENVRMRTDMGRDTAIYRVSLRKVGTTEIKK